jgi:hypothetical protein
VIDYSTDTSGKSWEFQDCIISNTVSPYSDVGNTIYTWPPNYDYNAVRAKELKAWLDGYLTDKKLSEKHLKVIREKLEEFIAS